MTASTALAERSRLARLAPTVATPAYVYALDIVRARLAALRDAFPGFAISYAIKANPHRRILALMVAEGTLFDASSLGEVRAALEAGAPPDAITFTGPGKTEAEIEGAVEAAIGGVVLESERQARLTAASAARRGRVQDVLVRIDPGRAPKGYGARMSMAEGQFGITEDELPAMLSLLAASPSLRLTGFHVYSVSNGLSAEAAAEHFAILDAVFAAAAAVFGRPVERLIYGAGFGVPYHDGMTPLDLGDASRRIVPSCASVRQATPGLAAAEPVLELGRWLVAPAGWLLTRVIDEKRRGEVELRICDAGFHHHLAACGMMGATLRRNWPILNLTNPGGAVRPFKLVGPLCTSIDMISRSIDLPEVRVGDVLAIALSGAYGPTASPTAFIGHGPPAEIVLDSDAAEAAA